MMRAGVKKLSGRAAATILVLAGLGPLLVLLTTVAATGSLSHVPVGQLIVSVIAIPLLAGAVVLNRLLTKNRSQQEDSQ